MKSNFKRRLRLVFLALAVLVLLLDLVRFSSTMFNTSGQVYGGEPVDLVAVLTGGQGRFKEAFSFLQAKRGNTLFISGIDEGVRIADIFKANGIDAKPEDYLIYPDRISKSTQANAEKIKETAEWLHAKTLLVVTSSYHMRRAMIKIEREMARVPALEVKIYQWPVESPNFDRNLWWRSFTGWKILFSEYFKSKADELFTL